MQFSSAVLIVLLFAIVVLMRRKRRRAAQSAPRRRFGVGPGASGTIYELLNDERRNAIEVIVEDKAAYKETEHADGNLPDLEKPQGTPR